MITSTTRGHKTIINKDGIEFYADTMVPVKWEERPCVKCGKMPTKEGYDACIGYIPGIKSACCGHGITVGYFRK